MVTEYEPDYLLVMLGFNDVGWFISDAEGTFESMKIFISEARAAKPDIKMALGNIPQRSFIGGREDLPIKTKLYNRMLAAAIPEWSMYIS
jgi:lysophospholipase L1-like esterase